MSSWKKLLLAALVLGLGFRMAAGTVPRMNLDEAWHYYLVRQPVGQWWPNLAKDRHPPLYDLVLGALVRMGAARETSLRWPMILTSWLTVGLVFLLGRELFGQEVGAGAAAFYAVAFMAWEYDTWIRGQAWLNPLAVLSTWLFVRLWKGRRPLDAAGYGAASALLLADHYLGFLVLGCHVLYALGRRRWDRWLVAGWSLCLLLYSPCIPLQQAQTRLRAGQDLSTTGSPALALRVALDLAGIETGLHHVAGLVRSPEGQERLPRLPLSVLWTVLGAWVLLPGLRATRDREHWGLFMLLLWLPPAVFLAAIALRTPEMYRPRYYALMLPYVGMGLAAACFCARPWARRAGLFAAGLILAVNLAVLVDYVRTGYFRYMDWKPLARWVAARQRDAEVVAVYRYDPLFALAYYYAGDDLIYSMENPWATHLEFTERFLKAGGLPLHRVRSVADLEARLQDVDRFILVLWMSDGPLRTYVAENFGVLDQLQIPNYQPDGAAECYLLGRRPRD